MATCSCVVLEGSEIAPKSSIYSPVRLTVEDLTLNGLLSQPLLPDQAAVASFRNLQYAKIPGRWHEAVPLNLKDYPRGELETVQWGPRPPQFIDVMHTLTGHLYPRLSHMDPTDEFKCLNLNVYAPATALPSTAEHRDSSTLLPVIVWIHGGSFRWGDGGCECDGQYLVARSIQANQPVLVVGINYRLGMLGFFTSKELRQEARDRGEKGYANLGFHDQRLALHWVQDNIHFFGGDKARITVAGESAGAISVLAHLRSHDPVARNAMLLSPATVAPRPFASTQVTFDKACETLGIAHESVSNKLKTLRQLPFEQLDKLGENRLENTLSTDPIFFDNWPSGEFDEVSVFPDWANRVVVGQLSEELALMGSAWKDLPPNSLLKAWKSVYTLPGYSDEVFSTYGVVDVDRANGATPSAGNSHVADALVNYLNDAIFDKAVRSIAEAQFKSNNPSKTTGPPARAADVYLYSFEQPDTIATDARLRNHAYHSLDNAFFFYFPAVTEPTADSRTWRTTTNSGHALPDPTTMWLAFVAGRQSKSVNRSRRAGNHWSIRKRDWGNFYEERNFVGIQS
ncbi:carboxylesterase [Cordyceps militaris CM01]|uniref:Carboxylic ester hydrolase n=1 Tax=Cordyceps militaris (strain CM01) TaxID=983644 RepID=G3JNJ8_CORMM|nr:carboxylesterase [Cordyceps militaris CM01]EGX89838.1 carboxylesterase [Cordyceps militaris CM01]